MAGGHVYILKNKGMPGLLKIGFTTRLPNERASELSTTGVPFPFVVAYSLEVNDPSTIEAELHSRLDGYRTSESREFFRLSIERAIAVVEELCGSGDDSIADYSLSPESSSGNGRYYQEASKYYPRSVSFSVGPRAEPETWFPDRDIALTRRGKIKCPHCNFMFEQSVSEATSFLPPLSVQCQSCRRTILLK